MILLSMKRNNISEVLVVRLLWPDFRAVGQWDHQKKVFIPYNYEEFTVDKLDSMVKYLKKHSANG